MPDLTGTTIGQYRLISTMGQGGMATVYRGYQAGMERYVAVKVINPEHGVDPNFVQRFRQEARVIAALEHPNILPVYDYGEAQGITYLVMRLVGSGTLADQMTGQPVPLDQVRRLLAEVGDALDYAHSRGVIHRDIKPSNILLDERGHTLLSDFGIAKLAQNLTGLTMTGSFVGTPYYASPEQALGQELDGRSDLYSLGVILYEMATGRQPYVADTPMAVLFKHIQEPLPAPRSLNPNLPPAVEQVIVKALSKNRTERFPTGAALSAALNAALVPGATAAGGRTVMEPAPDPNAAARTLLDRGMTPPGGQPIAPAYTAAPGAYPTAYPSQMPAAAPRRRSGLVWLAGGCFIFVTLLVLAVGAALLAPTLLRSAGILPGGAAATPIELGQVATPTNTAQAPATDTSAPATATASAPSNTPVPPIGSDHIFVEYILDASGSMLEPMDGTNRWEIARRVLGQRAAALPPDVHAGLRVYGHREPAEPADVSCADIQLLVPLAQHNSKAIVEALPELQARGRTPMSESIRLASEDFTFIPENRNSIVLISDGIETCGDDPSQMAAFLQELGIDFTIHVIGLDVDAATREQLRRLAETGHGIYHDATTEAELRDALEDIERAAVSPPESVAEVSPSPTVTPTDDSSVVAPGGPTRTLAPLFTATPTVTPTPEPTATRAPGVAVDVTFEGSVSASSTYPGFSAFGAVDGDVGTSWFSAGEIVDGASSYFSWTGLQEDFITAITIIGNGSNADPANRTGFGFDSVEVVIYDALDQVVFDAVFSLAGTPDPTVTVKAGVMGQTVQLIFFGHEAPDCGGFAELEIVVER